MEKYIIILSIFLIHLNFGTGYRVVLSDNGPVVLGAPITFRAELMNDYDVRPSSGTYKFHWRDNAIPKHSSESEGNETCRYWTISYPAKDFAPGMYEVEVAVYKIFVIPIPITSERIYFNVTSLLNGKMNIIQNNISRGDSSYVANNSPVNQTIEIFEADASFLKHNATQVITYWFVDCTYYGQTDDLSFIFTFNGSDKVHDVEALVVASFDPLPTPTPPTTTTTTTTTTTSTTPATTTTSTSTTTTTPKPTSIHPFQDYIPYLCLNSSVVPPDPSKTVGYFHRKLDSRSPVTNLTVTGNYWLQHGDILDLSVSCGGSPPYTRCFKIVKRAYNITGNETCTTSETTNICNFPIYRYLQDTTVYTIVIIISNDVNKVVHPVTVTIYEVKKMAQLSVVVVPVVFTLVAVILIVFGVAFYIQSRRRFTIEVADFDFGQANDLEYKSFRARLRDAFTDAFPGSSELLDTRSNSSVNRAPSRPIWTDRDAPKYGNVEENE